MQSLEIEHMIALCGIALSNNIMMTSGSVWVVLRKGGVVVRSLMPIALGAQAGWVSFHLLHTVYNVT